MASMASLLAQRLECGICGELYTDPKELSCEHAFCEKCLAELLKEEEELTCPTCQQMTQVDDGDASKLTTNFPIKALIEDLRAVEKVCTVCSYEMKSIVVAYCQTCGEYMCSECLEVHGKWKKYRGHEVVDGEAIKSGKVKVKQLCKKHPQEELEWACSTCKVSICFRCRMLYHNGSDHEVEEVVEFQKTLQEEAKTLLEEAEETVETIKTQVRVADEQKVKATASLDETVVEVIKAYDESVEVLTNKKDDLVKNLLDLKEGVTVNFQEFHDTHTNLMKDINSSCDVIAKGVEGFLEGESLVIHQKVYEELEGLLEDADLDEDNIQAITEDVEGIGFAKYIDQHELKFGELRNLPNPDGDSTNGEDKPWNLEMIDSFSVSGAGVADMAPTPDGQMAVGYSRGGIDLFNVHGLVDTVLDDAKITNLCVLPNSKYVVIDDLYELTVYTPKGKKYSSTKIDAKQKASLCLLKNEIYVAQYVGNHRAVVTQYKPTICGLLKGEEKEIRYTPDRACCMNQSSGMALVYYSSIEVLNEEFKLTHVLNVSGPFPVVLADNTILIGQIKDNMATVELYTSDLRYIRTVLKGFKLHGSTFLMAAFSSGEIAICDSRSLHVFQKC